jgi:hypothetical protein
MLKNLLTKKLYQFCFVITLISLLLNHKVQALTQVAGTTCLYAAPGEVITTNETLSTRDPDGDIRYSSGNYVDYRVPVAQKLAKNNLLCLKVPKYQRDSAGVVSKVSGTYYYYPIKDRGISIGSSADWLFRKCFDGTSCLGEDTKYDSLSSCMGSLGTSYKYFSERLSNFYPDENSCKTAELSGTSTTSDLKKDGACYWMEPGYAYNSNSNTPPEEAACSCYSADYLIRIGGGTRPPGSGWWPTSTYGVYYGKNIFGTTLFVRGPEKTYEDSASFNTNLQKCEQENPDRYYSKNTKRCYRTLDECKVGSLCSPAKEGHLFIVKSLSSYVSYDIGQQGTKANDMKSCAERGGTQAACLNSVYAGSLGTITKDQFYKCTCERPWTCGIIPGAACDKLCGLSRTPAPDFKVIAPIKISSPLALINVVVNFLFWLAVAIFVINILSASLDYIKGGDQPDKLKEASDRITGTIFGFVFLLVASGVINFIISRIKEFGL